MKKANYTFRFFGNCLSLLLLAAVFLFSPVSVNACEMSCAAGMQVSLGDSCTAKISAQTILTDDGASCPDSVFFSVSARLTMHGPNIADDTTIVLDGTYINRDLFVEVTARGMSDGAVVNRCWGTIRLEDKMAPRLDCPDVTVSCTADAPVPPSIIGVECGTDPVMTFSKGLDVSFCDSDTLKTYTQSWRATDAQGNTSLNPCVRTVAVIRLDTDSIKFPANLRYNTNNALACDSAYLRVEPGSIIPDPLVTGTPTFEGTSLFPTNNFNCNTVVTYTDQVIPVIKSAGIGCITKVMRTWVISEWICGEDHIRDSIQIIEIIDNEGPSIEPLNNVTISTSTGFDCEAAYLLPQVVALDNCGDVKRVSINYPTGYIEEYDGSEMITLKEGANNIYVTAFDACENETIDTFVVTVTDNNAPVAVCNKNTVVALSSNPNGLTTVSAITFDDGSYDECGLAYPSVAVKRMDDGAPCGVDGDEFGPYVQFCCADKGPNPMLVVLRATDLAGNVNTCMVNIEIQDKLPATIVAPVDITADCSRTYETTEEGLIAAFGDATAMDNCGDGLGNITRTFADSTTMCNTGLLTRYFSIPDGDGGFNVEEQKITFVNNAAFDFSTIQWPSDITLNACIPLEMGMATEGIAELSPDETGKPIITQSSCDMVDGGDYDDMVFEIFNSNSASCFKIIRTFNVADWCADTIVPYQQVIMIVNNVAPTLQLATDTININTAADACGASEVILRMGATDDCTLSSQLSWQYSIDENNDGIDITSEISLGTSLDSLNGGLASMLEVRGDFPIGSHRIIWSVFDRCGNITQVEQIFNISNNNAPTPYCYSGLAVSLGSVDTDGVNGPDAGQVGIWASDFDAGSYHPCIDDVTISFSTNPLDTGRVYTCDSIGQRDVKIYALVTVDNNTVVSDYCTSYIKIQDNQNICPDFLGGDDDNPLLLSGTISTENDQFIEEVKVQVLNMDMVPATTDDDGYYAFDDMKNGGAYQMHPEMNSDHLNGVTTIDLVLIQRHILGLQKLDSPYKIIASDINRDGSVSAKDLLILRKAILGIVDGFPGNESWRFVDRAYKFIDPFNPLTEQFRETYAVSNLASNMTLDFIGTKIGDVNGNVVASSNYNASVRNASTLDFVIENQSVKAGTTVEIPVFAENFTEIIAYQYSIELDTDVEFVSTRSGALDLASANFGINRASEGIVTTSWDNHRGTTLTADEPLFYVTVNVLSDVKISQAIEFNSSVTKAEAYSLTEALDISLESRTIADQAGDFKLHQNTPNPFQGRTNIKFELSRDDHATLSIFDVTGKLVKSVSGDYVKGYNNIELDVQELGVNGVLFYTLSTENHTATKKMVVIK